MNSKEIRQAFFDFFHQKSHQIVPSAPMVIKNDPTLMFVNAGMNPFKSYFLGTEKPTHRRIADTQKCLRVSGKHNDLEEVGIDTYHHTLFEMLGNWSFGDPANPAGGYFKQETIAWAWELLTEVYKIDKNILYVTIFEGDENEGLQRDSDAYNFWKTHISEDRILLGNKKDNFWEMGDQGPCGPCSEIHVDIRSADEKAKIPGRDLVNQSHPQVVEIWNLVFMEYNRKANGTLEKLPAKHIDTGMGFERLCMVLQGVKSNYDSDVFTPLIRKIEKITHTTYGKNTETDIAIRVVADHVRAVTFSIADGQLPSNTGAGYVIRRILRRAIRYGFTFLNQKDAFIYQLVDTLSEQMGEVFPELIKEKNLITNVIREEEQSFLKTLEQGLLLLNDLTKNMDGKRLSGAKAFELYDTFGFPVDLTALILSEKGYDLDVKEFEVALQNQKNRSRAAAEITKDDWTILFDKNETNFVGYDQLECQSKITRYRKIDSKKDGKLYQIVLDETPFYPEGGGQVGDKGVLVSAHEQIKIIDTKKENNQIVHTTDSLPKNPQHTFTAKVDAKLRKLSEANHSATHLMHQALREVLGTHVEQKGSLVSPNHLRFDFSHFAKMTDEELQKVEVFVNARIAENLPLEERRKVPFAEAVSEGAMALFGEKYGDSVRAIRFGNSIELCGGTHVKNTADIWHFKIVSEGAVASGIRRIEAITSDAVKAYFDNQATQLEEIKQLLKNPIHPTKALQLILEDNNSIKKQIDALLREKALGMKGDLEAELEDLNGVKFLAKKIDLEQNALKDLVFELGKSHDNLFVLLATQPDNDKVMLTCYISKELTEKRGYDAGKVVRELGKLIHGGGGGQAFFATAGGKNPGGIPKALARAKDYLV